MGSKFTLNKIRRKNLRDSLLEVDNGFSFQRLKVYGKLPVLKNGSPDGMKLVSTLKSWPRHTLKRRIKLNNQW